ncbi:MAG: class I adenylate-forming enzyme family protein [Oscillospiraceae bacterium]|nr:class I adenylate-forming enzyme family protein [Oscillospiraceae bacterium]
MLYLGDGAEFASAQVALGDTLPHDATDITVYREILENNIDRLDETALMFLGTKVSYRALFGQADRIADILASKGIKKGDMILTCINGTPQSVSILLACSKMGVGAMMLTPKTTEAMFAHVVDDYSGTYLFCMTQFYPIFATMDAIDRLKQVVIMPDDKTIGMDIEQKTKLSASSNIIHWAEFINSEVTAPAVEVKGGEYPLAICFTTGSTSVPKGILLPNRSYIALEKICETIGWDWKKGDMLFSIVPTFVATGISLVLLIPLAMGVTVLQEPRLNPFETFIYNLVTYRPSIVLATKSIWMSMADTLRDHYDLTAVKYAFTVGETISQTENRTVNKFLSDNGSSAKLENMYGMSECNSILTYHNTAQRSEISAGIHVPYAAVAVFDLETGKECKFGEIGQVFFKTPAAMRAYFMDPAATEEFFVQDDKGGKWGKTGDVGYVAENGEIFICCRAKERFTDENGRRIFPFLIEDVIKTDPNIKRCKIVSTVYDGKPALAVHITLIHAVGNEDEYVSKLHEMCRAEKSLTILPKLYKIRPTLPISQAGKIDMIAMAAETEGFIVK